MRSCSVEVHTIEDLIDKQEVSTDGLFVEVASKVEFAVFDESVKNFENNRSISVLASDTNNEDVSLLDEQERVGSDLLNGELGLLWVDYLVTEGLVHSVSVCMYVSLVFSLQLHSQIPNRPKSH